MWTPAYLTTSIHQKNVHELITPSLSLSSQVETQRFREHEPSVSPLPGKAMTLSFSTSPKGLSLRLASVPLGGEAGFLAPAETMVQGDGWCPIHQLSDLRGRCGSERGSPENPQALRHHVDALTQTQMGVVRGQHLKHKFRGLGYS